MTGLACLQEGHGQAGLFSEDRWCRPGQLQVSPGDVRGKENSWAPSLPRSHGWPCGDFPEWKEPEAGVSVSSPRPLRLSLLFYPLFSVPLFSHWGAPRLSPIPLLSLSVSPSPLSPLTVLSLLGAISLHLCLFHPQPPERADSCSGRREDGIGS